jgi:hypothetical protein
MSSTNWLFTLNNPTADFKPEIAWQDHYTFLIYQKEKGEEGTEHLQGYCIMKKKVRLSAMKKICGKSHWEIRKGNHLQAKTYCSKEETRVSGPYQFGTEPAQGKRSDLDAVKEDIDAGHSMLTIAQNHFGPYIKYYKGFEKYCTLSAKPRNFKTEVYVVWGPTGTGKSYWCNEQSPDAYWFFPQKEGKWFDNYDGIADIIIDEFYGSVPHSALLRYLDRYKCHVETKGGGVNFAPKRIFITSNSHPYDWYKNYTDKYPTLRRRFSQILCIKNREEMIREFWVNPDGSSDICPLDLTVLADMNAASEANTRTKELVEFRPNLNCDSSPSEMTNDNDNDSSDGNSDDDISADYIDPFPDDSPPRGDDEDELPRPAILGKRYAFQSPPFRSKPPPAPRPSRKKIPRNDAFCLPKSPIPQPDLERMTNFAFNCDSD